VILAAGAAAANDSTAELGAGGLELVRNDAIELLSEDLYVSADEVRVTYHFRNRTPEAVTYLVAFPLPAIDASTPEEANFVLPDEESDNFVDFEVTVDGQPVMPSISTRAIALGVDQAETLRRYGLPLNPVGYPLYQQLQTLPESERDELNRLGLILVDEYSVQAAWRNETTFYWEQTFLPGREVVVEHHYKPVVGYGFFGEWALTDDSYRQTYCMDDAFISGARRRLAAIANDPNPYLDELRISYILTTANNWAGAIQSFHLVVDKGEPEAIVSFCGEGVRKISPTEFEIEAKDFYPERDLEILIARPSRQN
jgi:hypothetical protein